MRDWEEKQMNVLKMRNCSTYWLEHLNEYKYILLFIRKDVVEVFKETQISQLIWSTSNKHIELYNAEKNQLYMLYHSHFGRRWYFANITNGIGEAPERYTCDSLQLLMERFDVDNFPVMK